MELVTEACRKEKERKRRYGGGEKKREVQYYKRCLSVKIAVTPVDWRRC